MKENPAQNINFNFYKFLIQLQAIYFFKFAKKEKDMF